MGASPIAARGLFRTYTTTQAGLILSLSARTVTKLCDAGKLGHYRVQTGRECGDRRIPEEELIAYMERTPGLAERIPRLLSTRAVILAGVPDHLCTLIPPGTALVRCADLFHLGVECAAGPACVVLDATGLGSDAALLAARALRRRNAPVAVLLTEDGAYRRIFAELGCEPWGCASPQLLADIIQGFAVALPHGPSGRRKARCPSTPA